MRTTYTTRLPILLLSSKNSSWLRITSYCCFTNRNREYTSSKAAWSKTEWKIKTQFKFHRRYFPLLYSLIHLHNLELCWNSTLKCFWIGDQTQYTCNILAELSQEDRISPRSPWDLFQGVYKAKTIFTTQNYFHSNTKILFAFFSVDFSNSDQVLVP